MYIHTGVSHKVAYMKFVCGDSCMHVLVAKYTPKKIGAIYICTHTPASAKVATKLHTSANSCGDFCMDVFGATYTPKK